MPLVPIASLDDPHIAPYRQLKLTSDMRRAGLFIAEGDKLVQRMLQSRYAVHSVLAGEKFIAASSLTISQDVTTFLVPDNLLREVVGFKFHRGVLGCGYRGRASQSMQSVIDCLADQAVGSQATVLVCVDIQDPTNLGAILRTADAFGVTAVVLAGNCADPFSRRVLRVSMGATFQLILIQTDDLAGVLTALRHRCQMKLVAAVASNAGEPLERVDRDSRVALLLGNESRGLSDEWIRLCDRQVTIPMHSHADSLNVAVATGILLYHYCTPALSRDFGVRQEASGASHL